MPNYDYQCVACGNTFEKKLPIAEYEKPLRERCPVCDDIGSIEQYLPSAPGIGDPVRLGIKKPPADFMRGVVDRIRSSVPGAAKMQTKFQVPSQR